MLFSKLLSAISKHLLGGKTETNVINKEHFVICKTTFQLSPSMSIDSTFLKMKNKASYTGVYEQAC